MSLDRQSVEKRDFPIARRGYEPEAVDQHLQQVADELDRLRRQAAAGAAQPAPAGPASIAAAASEQVRAIVEAAESSAAQIERAARDEADGIRRSAEADAASARQEAVQRSEEHVGKVSEATRLMLQRVDAMETELQALVESLRTGANRLTADLSLLQGNLGELYDATGAGGTAAPPPPAPVAS
jgi:DivIVA domain-containing protein